MALSRRSLFLITGALALRQAFKTFRGEPKRIGPIITNDDPVEVRLAYFGNISCESPRFYRDRPILAAVAEDEDDHGAFDPPEPHRWERVAHRWASKHSADH